MEISIQGLGQFKRNILKIRNSALLVRHDFLPFACTTHRHQPKQPGGKD